MFLILYNFTDHKRLRMMQTQKGLNPDDIFRRHHQAKADTHIKSAVHLMFRDMPLIMDQFKYPRDRPASLVNGKA